MILSEDNVLAYLADHGLLPAGPGDSWAVSGAPSRNRNFSAVPAHGGAGFFLKQLRVLVPESVVMMQREATVYWLCRNDEDFAGLRSWIPPFVFFDGLLKILVLGLLPASRNLLRHQQELGDFSVPVGEALGEALATVHRRVGLHMRSEPDRAAFPREIPGIFTAHRDGPLVRWLGPGQMRLIDQVRAHPRLAPALDRLAGSWSFDTWTHGDLKFENCVVSRGPDGSPQIRLVDWELADFGDPAWDAGCLVQAWLYVCLSPFLAVRGESLRDRLARAGERAASMRAALRGFWRTYQSGLELEGSARDAMLERVLVCTSARLIQMALEVMHGQPEPPPPALSLLEASDEVLSRPRETGCLLGLEG